MSSRINCLKYESLVVGISKMCRKCLKSKDASLFYDSKSNKDGKKNNCIECDLEIKRLYYLKNNESIIKKQKDYYRINIDESREKSRLAVKKFKERNPFYYSKLKTINESDKI